MRLLQKENLKTILNIKVKNLPTDVEFVKF